MKVISISLTVIIISHISNHHDALLKYLQFFFVNYTSIKLEKGKKKKRISYVRKGNEVKLKEKGKCRNK